MHIHYQPLLVLLAGLSSTVQAYKAPDRGVRIGEHSRLYPDEPHLGQEKRMVHLGKRQSSGGDPCAALSTSGATAYLPSEVLACVRSIPFSQDIRQSVMSTVTALNSLNVFQYNQIADASPALNQGVNLDDEFRRINSSSYSSDYDFQIDLHNTINKLNDGHYGYSNCYIDAFSVSHALPIVALASSANDTNTNVYLAPDLPLYVQGSGLSQLYAQFGINATSLAGLQVTKYDGQDIWEYLNTTLLAKVGTYQDPSQRLNSIFASYQSFSGQMGRNSGAFGFTTDLSKDNFTLTVRTQDGQERAVQVPWVSTYAGRNGFQFTSGTSFFNSVCRASTTGGTSASRSLIATSTRIATTTRTSTSRSSASTATASVAPVNLGATATRLYAACPIGANSSRYPLQGSVNPLASGAYLGGRDIMFFVLPGTKIGVVYISTFGPEAATRTGSTSDCQNRFALDMVLGFRNFTQAGVTSILIDTSNNGGGSVALNQFAQRIVTGDQFTQDINFKNVFRKSPLSEALRAQTVVSGQDGLWAPGTFRSGTSALADNANYFDPGQTKQINSQSLSTSNDLQDPIANIQRLASAYGLGTSPAYSSQNVVFIGNGLCGSACSSFTNFLVEYFNATAYIAAARPSQAIEFQAFAAGQAIGSDDIFADAQDIGFTNTALLPPFVTTSSFNFALRASISPLLSPGTFLQYRPFFAQKRFALTRDTYLDPIKQWTYIASQVYPDGGNGRAITGGGGNGTGTGTNTGGGSGGGSAASRRADVGVVGLGAAVALAVLPMIAWVL